MIHPRERERFLSIPMCGDRVVDRLESIGVTCLADLRERDPWDLLDEVNLAAGHVIWRPPMAIIALENVVMAARKKR